MASLNRKTTTRPLPKSAELIERGGRQLARWKDRSGRTRTAPLVLNADGTPKRGPDGRPRIRTRSATVFAKLRIGGAVRVVATGCRTEDGATHRLGELVKRAEHLQANILTPSEARSADYQTTPLPGHVAAFELALQSRGVARLVKDRRGKLRIETCDDRGRVLDLHALRHTYGTLLAAAGVPLQVAQRAMRHSDVRLTTNVYTDPRLLDLRAAVEALPHIAATGELLHDAARATGTDDDGGPSLVAPTVAPASGNVGLCSSVKVARHPNAAEAAAKTRALVSVGKVETRERLSLLDNRLVDSG